MVIFASVLLSQADWLLTANDHAYRMVNDLAGQSFVFDKLMGLGLSSALVKAAMIGSCFMFAWLAGDDPVKVAARRKVLLITLISSVFVLATTKTLSKVVFLPRPFIQSEKSFHLEGDQLVESPRVEYHIPFDEESQKNYRDLTYGEVQQNDMGSFPSDHAGFFITIAAGIFLAYRGVGIIALLWTVFVPLGAKVMLGDHSPLDIIVGGGIGVFYLLLVQFILNRRLGRPLDPIVKWTMNNSALSAALLFIVLFEVTNTLDDVRQIGHVGKDVTKHVLGRQ